MATEEPEIEQVQFVDPNTQPTEMKFAEIFQNEDDLNAHVEMEEFAKGWSQPLRKHIILAVGASARHGWKGTQQDDQDKYVYVHELLSIDEDDLMKRPNFGKEELHEFRLRVEHMTTIKKPKHGFRFESDSGHEFVPNLLEFR